MWEMHLNMSLRRTSATRPSAPIWLAALAALAASACATQPAAEPAAKPAPVAAAKPAAPAAPAAAPSPAATALAPPPSFVVCTGCHGTKPGAPPSLGPNLFGLAGKKAGAVPGFVYSDAMKASTLVWTEATLAAFTADPAKTIPDNEMDFSGISDPAAAKAIGAYLAALK